MASQRKIDEANEHIRQAEKSLKTGLLKWKPDYDVAADEYNKAGVAFRIAKEYEKSVECFLKCAENYKLNRSWFHAAKAMEAAVQPMKEMGLLKKVPEFIEQAAVLYQQHGSPEAAIATLEKCSKFMENTHPDLAILLLNKAVDIVMIEDSSRQGIEYLNRLARLMVKHQFYDDATDAIRREIILNQKEESFQAIGRLAVVLVLVQLARADYVAAEKAFKEWGNYCEPSEIQTLEMLLQGFDDEDPDLARRALSSPFIRHMDVEFSIMARDLPLPSGLSTAPKASVIENAVASYKSPNAPPGEESGRSFPSEDDIEEGGLC
ncbi:gamma-soluble NSF attachment protein-like isoform X2 [Lutzomyia longipalpis]|uniref:Gamma-soluble NSF attachment protein n=1 Tax=Lutzomyia longipalpis TaxID=7200 RepID=A0A7G3ATZ7_LUTLO|nr:gamma-soluble NSF attachment protein-like isoform X2 [Lutzomyia longipalpis]